MGLRLNCWAKFPKKLVANPFRDIRVILFNDICASAGKIRTADISHGNSRFANVRLIESISKNALHPFRDGDEHILQIKLLKISTNDWRF